MTKTENLAIVSFSSCILLLKEIWGHDVMELLSPQSPIHIDGTDVMELPLNDYDNNNNDKGEG